MIAIQNIDEESMRTTGEGKESRIRHLFMDSYKGWRMRNDIDVTRVNIHTAIPVVEDYAAYDDEGDVISEEGETDDDDEKSSDSYLDYYGSLSIIMIHIYSFLTFVIIFGIDSISSNPLIGPPLQVIEEYGAKASIKIKDGHEYWRIVSAMFINVGFLDLFFTVCMLYTFGRCLEKRWGCIKWLSFYLLSGEYLAPL